MPSTKPEIYSVFSCLLPLLGAMVQWCGSTESMHSWLNPHLQWLYSAGKVGGSFSLSNLATSGFSGRTLSLFQSFPRLTPASSSCDNYKVRANDFFSFGTWRPTGLWQHCPLYCYATAQKSVHGWHAKNKSRGVPAGMSVHDRRLSASLWRHIIENLHIYGRNR